jgi:hypothetical protein
MYHHNYTETWRYLERANRTGIDFLLAELDIGLTFLQIADVTMFPSTRRRDLNNALQVYRTVVRLLPRVILSDDDQSEFNSKLRVLRARLENAGISLDV